MPWEPWRKGVRHAMGAMAKRWPWQKDALENVMAVMAPIAKQKQYNPERNPFRVARRFIMLHHHDSS